MGDNDLDDRTLYREVVDSIASVGLRATAAIALTRLADSLFDLRYGTDTVERLPLSRLDVAGGNRRRGQRYQPTGTLPFRKLVGLYRFPEDGVLVDFGSGKGRVLLMASRLKLKRVVGIEFSSELVRISRANIERFRRRTGTKVPIEVIHSDVTAYRFRHDESIFYFFHPFDEAILRQVLSNIRHSLELRPRPAWLVYYYPIHRSAVEEEAGLRKLGEHVLSGYECVVYGSDGRS